MSIWTPHPVSARARAALATLSAPFTPQPLPVSVRLTPSVFFLPQTSAAARDAYRAPGAPVPAGATLREENGVLIVEAPFVPSAIFFTDTDKGCTYRIAVKPTLVVKGIGDVPDINAFARVAVAGKLLMSQTSVAGKPWMIVVNSQEDDDHPSAFGTVRQMSLAQVQSDDNFEEHGSWWPATIEQMPGKVLRVKLQTKSGPVVIEAIGTDTLTSLASWAASSDVVNQPPPKGNPRSPRNKT
jgi:hypothetical protein